MAFLVLICADHLFLHPLVRLTSESRLVYAPVLFSRAARRRVPLNEKSSEGFVQGAKPGLIVYLPARLS